MEAHIQEILSTIVVISVVYLAVFFIYEKTIK